MNSQNNIMFILIKMSKYILVLNVKMNVLFVVYCSNTHCDLRTHQFVASTLQKAENLAKQWLDKDAFHYLFRECDEDQYQVYRQQLSDMAYDDRVGLKEVIALFHNFSYIEIQTEVYQHA